MRHERETAPSREEEHFYGAMSLFHDVEARRIQRITHERDPKINPNEFTRFPNTQKARTEFSNALWSHVKETLPPEYRERLLTTMTSIYSYDGLHHKLLDLGADWVREQNDPFFNLTSGMEVINLQWVNCLDYVVDRMLIEPEPWNGIRSLVGYRPPRVQ